MEEKCRALSAVKAERGIFPPAAQPPSFSLENFPRLATNMSENYGNDCFHSAPSLLFFFPQMTYLCCQPSTFLPRIFTCASFSSNSNQGPSDTYSQPIIRRETCFTRADEVISQEIEAADGNTRHQTAADRWCRRLEAAERTDGWLSWERWKKKTEGINLSRAAVGKRLGTTGLI